ncbi:MAG: hypothetical protein ACLTNP_03515 [Streptococcus salivarius]
MVYGKSGKLSTQTGWKEVTVKDDSGKEEKFYQYFFKGGIMATGLTEVENEKILMTMVTKLKVSSFLQKTAT